MHDTLDKKNMLLSKLYSFAKTIDFFEYLTMGSIVTLIPLFWVWQSFPFIIWADLVVIGIFFLAATTLFTFACKYISVILVSILFYSTIIFTALLDWWIWQKLPDLMTTIGILLVIGSGILSTLLEKKKSKPSHS